MLQERIEKYIQLEKLNKELYTKEEDAKRLIENKIKELQIKYLNPILEEKEAAIKQMKQINDSIEKEVQQGLYKFKNKEYSEDEHCMAIKLLQLIKEYSEFNKYYKWIQDVEPLFEYFLKIKDADSCATLLKYWHKINMDGSSIAPPKFEEEAKGYEKLSHFAKKTKPLKLKQSDCPYPRGKETLKLMQLLGCLDAKESKSDNEIYYSPKSKKIILFGAVGGFSHLIIPDKTYLGQNENEKRELVLKYWHDLAYIEQKRILKTQKDSTRVK